MVVVYISSPYTIGDTAHNVRRQMEVADQLLDLGYCPDVPLWSHFQQISYPRRYEEWLRIDKEKVLRSDVILRLYGESKGADREVKWARLAGKMVVHSVKELKRRKPPK